VVKVLLARDDVDPESKDNYGRTPLSWAAGNGHEAVVKLLLDQGIEINADGGKGAFDPLQAAAYGGHEAVVQLLLDKDADIRKEGLYGTAFGAAAFAGHKAVIEQLLDHETDKNLVDSHGRNALHLAPRGGHIGIVNYLMDLGLDAAAKDKRGFTILYYAAASGLLEGLERVLQIPHFDWERSNGW
jgi:ankyrin repeat protein